MCSSVIRWSGVADDNVMYLSEVLILFLLVMFLWSICYWIFIRLTEEILTEWLFYFVGTGSSEPAVYLWLWLLPVSSPIRAGPGQRIKVSVFPRRLFLSLLCSSTNPSAAADQDLDQDLVEDHGCPGHLLLHQRPSWQVSEWEKCGDRVSGEVGGENWDKEEDHCSRYVRFCSCSPLSGSPHVLEGTCSPGSVYSLFAVTTPGACEEDSVNPPLSWAKREPVYVLVLNQYWYWWWWINDWGQLTVQVNSLQTFSLF